jgi:hypothetical protein
MSPSTLLLLGAALAFGALEIAAAYLGPYGLFHDELYYWAPFMLIHFSFYSVNAIEILLWTATTFLMLELIRTGNDRWWLAIGMVSGIGLLNKHTFALLAFSIQPAPQLRP